MNHITFLSTGEPVCENPKRLGHDVVGISASNYPDSCKDCMGLIRAFNERRHTPKYDIFIHPPQPREENTFTWVEHSLIVACVLVWIAVVALGVWMVIGA